MAAALFAGAASSGGGAGVTILGLGCRVDGVLGCVARGRRGRGPARFSSSDLYKAVGAGLLRVAKVAKRFDLRQFVGYLVCCLAARSSKTFWLIVSHRMRRAAAGGTAALHCAQVPSPPYPAVLSRVTRSGAVLPSSFGALLHSSRVMSRSLC